MDSNCQGRFPRFLSEFSGSPALAGLGAEPQRVGVVGVDLEQRPAAPTLLRAARSQFRRLLVGIVEIAAELASPVPPQELVRRHDRPVRQGPRDADKDSPLPATNSD